MLKRKLDIPIFEKRIYLFYSGMEEIKTEFGGVIGDGHDGEVFIFTEKDGNSYLGVYISKEATRPLEEVISHECVHLGFAVLEQAGQKVGMKNHEVLAYLTGYLVKEITSIINRNKKKRSK